jgi:hypothetical protein
MTIEVIRRAFQKRLAAMSGVLSASHTVYENTIYKPSADGSGNPIPYQKVNLLPAAPENPSIGNGHYREIGIFQVTLFYPQNTGPQAAQAMANSIQQWFYRGLSLIESGVTVIIERTPAIAPALMIDDRYVVPVSVRYYADFFT